VYNVRFFPSVESLEKKLNLDSLPVAPSYFGGVLELPQIPVEINPNNPVTWPNPDYTLSPYPTQVVPPFGYPGNEIPWNGVVSPEELLPAPNSGQNPLPLNDYNLDCPPLACLAWAPDDLMF
jgi:hypothetical protein